MLVLCPPSSPTREVSTEVCCQVHVCTGSVAEGAQLERRGSRIHFLPFPCLLSFRVVRFACLSFQKCQNHLQKLRAHLCLVGCNGSWWCRFSFVVLCICIEVKYTKLRICHYKFIVNVLCMMLYNCLYYVFPKPSVHPNRHQHLTSSSCLSYFCCLSQASCGCDKTP